ncbi:hypothetical protein GCM10010428_65650 [Actinosynnema pretiosum subsp. pretiosum]
MGLVQQREGLADAGGRAQVDAQFASGALGLDHTISVRGGGRSVRPAPWRALPVPVTGGDGKTDIGGLAPSQPAQPRQPSRNRFPEGGNRRATVVDPLRQPNKPKTTVHSGQLSNLRKKLHPIVYSATLFG